VPGHKTGVLPQPVKSVPRQAGVQEHVKAQRFLEDFCTG
jgi:hypothetical protein